MVLCCVYYLKSIKQQVGNDFGGCISAGVDFERLSTIGVENSAGKYPDYCPKITGKRV